MNEWWLSEEERKKRQRDRVDWSIGMGIVAFLLSGVLLANEFGRHARMLYVLGVVS